MNGLLLDTHVLVWALDGLGIEHGTDLDALVATSTWMAQQLGKPPASRVVRALAGADDPSTGPDDLRFIADRIPGARLEVVDDAAHLANVEQADAVNRLLVEHLRDGGR